MCDVAYENRSPTKPPESRSVPDSTAQRCHRVPEPRFGRPLQSLTARGWSVTSYVLVHGGAQGAWCWDRLVPRLRLASGVDAVVAVDLPGHGAKRLDDHRHIGLVDSARTIVDAIVANGLTEVVLVGHAMGAIAVVEAAPLLANRLSRIVFLAGMVPGEGMSADQMLGTRFDENPSQWERIAATPEREVYGADMDDATAAWFFAHLTAPEDRPYQPPRTPVHVSGLPTNVPV